MPIQLKKLTVTHVLIAINVIVFILMFLSDPGISNQTLVNFGAKFNPLIDSGEYYRLLTAAFVHVDIPHILFNCFALYILGPIIESLFGKSRFLAIYFASAVMGTAMSYAFSQSISAGASGAIFGLLGTHMYLFARHRSNYLKIFGKDFLVMIGLNLLIGITSSNIDNFGHIGGLIGGFLFAPLVGINHEKFPKTIGLLTFAIYLGLMWFFLI